jgi:antagonist of KipI
MFFLRYILQQGEITGEPYRTYDLNEGDQLDILATKASVYGYLSIEGGFKLDKFCGSVSSQPRAFIGPNDGKKIELKDKILIFKNSTTKENKIIRNIKFDEKKIFSVLPGPQFHYFSAASKKQFFSTPYLITKQTDRMGMRVLGKSLENLVNSNIPSEGIIKGAIQVPGDGNPIILLSDHPTTGGYPKVGSIISSDYDDLIQQNSNKEIYFQLVTLEAAEQQFALYMEKIKRRITNIEKI